MVPVLEHDVGGGSPKMFEEPIRRAPRDDGLPPGQQGQLGGGMGGKGQQIEGHQNTGEGFPAMPEIVLEILAVGLEHIEGFVLDPRLRGDKPTNERVHRRRVRQRCRM